MGKLDDQVAIVTGASSGIGEATARALAAEGAAVTLAARRTERLEALKDEIEQQGGRALVVETDVTKRDDVANLAAKTKEAFGTIDILVNNAGIMLLSYLEKRKLDEWEAMLDVNIKGVLYGVYEVLPTMIEQQSGHIINVSSVAGRRVIPSGAVYSATKFAVTAFSEGMRQELTPKYGIRVTSIEPGIVATELATHISDEDVIERFKGMADKITPLTSEDIADTILYAVTSPQHVSVHELLVLPSDQG